MSTRGQGGLRPQCCVALREGGSKNNQKLQKNSKILKSIKNVDFVPQKSWKWSWDNNWQHLTFETHFWCVFYIKMLFPGKKSRNFMFLTKYCVARRVGGCLRKFRFLTKCLFLTGEVWGLRPQCLILDWYRPRGYEEISL